MIINILKSIDHKMMKKKTHQNIRFVEKRVNIRGELFHIHKETKSIMHVISVSAGISSFYFSATLLNF